LIHKEKGDFAWALKRYHQSLQVTSKNSLYRVASLSEIGIVLQHQNHLDQAMEYHQRAFEIELDDPKILALRYANLGSTLCAQRKFDEALKSFEQALHYLLPKHPERAKVFDHIGSVYYALESYSTALLYYQTALETAQSSLLPTHLDNVRIRFNITKTLDKLKRV
jgi:tetratricopeptide (TPR) repeat protein